MSYLNTSWQNKAACAGHDRPEIFFPTKTGKAAIQQSAEALAICSGCPVIEACAQYRIDTGSIGVWGNALIPTREAHRPHAVRVRKVRCGTRAGYERHLKRNEPPCQPCRNAEVAAKSPQGNTRKKWTA